MLREFNQSLNRWRKSVIKYRIEASDASAELRKIIQTVKNDKTTIKKLTDKFAG